MKMQIELPQAAYSRFVRLPETADAATWVCPTCGVIAPNRLCARGIVRYARKRCACEQALQQRQEREQRKREWCAWQAGRTYSWLGSRWSDAPLRYKTFDTFQAVLQPEAFDAARLFAAHPSGTLVLYGTFGTGKTHLLAGVCNAALLNTPSVTSLFTTAPKLFAAIGGRIQEEQGYSDIIERAIATPLLVIDDVDKAKHTEFREEIYFAIIDERVKLEKPTAISTNRLSTLADYVGGAVCSRLKVGQIAVEMTGEDYREEL
jgi:DNA replication protein DnaC